MLINSDRIKPEDFELWKDYEDLDALNAAKLSDVKIEQAIDCIQFVAKESKSYVSVSWGKDSVVIWHLAQQAGVNLPVVWIKEFPMHNPHCEDVRDVCLSMHKCQYHEMVCDYANVGFMPFLDKKEGSTLFNAVAKAINHVFGRRITGIRAQESKERRLRMRKHGLNTKNTSCPIGWWTTQDVFAYLKKYDLPVHPNYAMLGNGRWDRDKIRVDCIAGALSEGDGIGRVEFEREYYQDVLNKISAF